MKKENLIPLMTSKTSPSGECNSSSDWTNRYSYKAFDRDIDTLWTSDNKNPWISYTFESSTVVNEICIIHHDDRSCLYWDTAEVYGDDELLTTVTLKDIKEESKYITFSKSFNNFKKYKTYKILFNTPQYTYISKIELYYNDNYKFIVNESNKYKTINNNFYDISDNSDIDNKQIYDLCKQYGINNINNINEYLKIKKIMMKKEKNNIYKSTNSILIDNFEYFENFNIICKSDTYRVIDLIRDNFEVVFFKK